MAHSFRPCTAALTACAVSLVLAACARTGHVSADPADNPTPADRLIEVQANVYAGSAQAHAALATAPDGGLVVAWDSRRQQDGSYGVYARRYDAIGRPLTDEVPINIPSIHMQTEPAVAAGPDGAVWFAWISFGQDGDGQGIVARRLDPTLTTGGPELAVNQTQAGDQFQPSITVDDHGNALVTWTSRDRTNQSRVMARLFGPDGTALGDEFAVVVPPANLRDTTATTAALGDGFVVAWVRGDSDGVPNTVLARTLDSTGSRMGDVMTVSQNDGRHHLEPSIASDGAGRFVVAWMSESGDDYAVDARWYDGTTAGPIVAVADATLGPLSGASAAMSPEGKALIAFNRFTPGEQAEDVYAVGYDEAGRVNRELFRVNRHTDGRQMLAVAGVATRVALTARGQVALAWSGDAGLGDKSAANLTMLTPGSFFGQLAAQPAPTPSRVSTTMAAEPQLPPIWDPDFKRELPDRTVRGDGPDTGFLGVTSTGWTPPDPEMAVGLNHIVVMTNGEISFFDKNGNNLFRDEIENSFGFWGSLGANNFVFDPETLYDPHTDRFFAMASERANNNHSYFLLAVSDDGNPVGTWYKYRLDVTALAGDDIDSPNMSVDDQAVYLTADFFGPDKYLVYIIDKASIISGGTPSVTSYLFTGEQSMGLPVMWDNTAPNQYIIESTEFTTNTTVKFHAILDPLTAPNIVTTTVNVEPYLYPTQPPQKGTSTRPYLFEPRFWSCQYIDGSLWAVHHIRPSGGTRTIVRWYEFHMNGWPWSGQQPTVAQWGEIDPGGSAHAYFPSIGADADGNAAITMARSSSTEYIGMWRAVRRHNDAPGTFRPMQLVKGSSGPDTSGRWGDYSFTQPDPGQPCAFWGHHEWTTGSWRTWIARYLNYADVDLNQDCNVDSQDFILFLNAFVAGDDLADFNGDGVVDSQDFIAFLNAFTSE